MIDITMNILYCMMRVVDCGIPERSVGNSSRHPFDLDGLYLPSVYQYSPYIPIDARRDSNSHNIKKEQQNY
jgi:hypothetical protein